MDEPMNETGHWLASQARVELDLGCLVAAASAWTEDEFELDDMIAGLVDSGRVQLQIG